MSEHTPGPWRIFYEGSGDYLVLGAAGEEVASVSRPDAHFMHSGPGAPINEANARLIAAAPELLDWLRAHVEAYGQCECRPDGIICPHCRAQALLARLAPGEQSEPAS